MRSTRPLALSMCIGHGAAMSSDPRTVFKIFRPNEWEALCRDGETLGSPLDLTDGFLHFSTKEQLAETLRLHFTDAGDLVLADVPLSALSDRDLRWEAARTGSLFPHLYGVLLREDVSRHWTLHADPAGRYALPDGV